MPKLFKRGKYWHFRIGVNGRDRWVSTKCTNRKEAAIVAEGKTKALQKTVSAEVQFDGLMMILALLPQADADKLRREFSRRLFRGQSVTLPLAAAWDAWQRTPTKGNPSPRTVSMYKAIWSAFEEWITGKANGLHEVSQAQAEQYAATLWEKKVSPRTYNAHIQFLRSLFKTLHTQGGLIVNPFEAITSLDNATEGRTQFTADELRAICSKAQGSMRYMIGAALYTGLRLGDVVGLRWQDIGPDSITVIPSKTKRKGKQLTIPLHPVLSALLAELKAAGSGTGYLFPVEKALYDRHLSGVSKPIQEFFTETCKIITTEAAEEGGQRKRAIVRKGFHSLRHSFVSLCAANRVPQSAIMELVGHGSPAMTALYTHAGDEQKAAAIAALPDFTKKARKKRAKRIPAAQVSGPG